MQKALIFTIASMLVLGVGCSSEPESSEPESSDVPAPAGEETEGGEVNEQGCYVMYSTCYAPGSKYRYDWHRCCTPQTTGGYYCYTYKTTRYAGTACYGG